MIPKSIQEHQLQTSGGRLDTPYIHAGSLKKETTIHAYIFSILNQGTMHNKPCMVHMQIECIDL